MTHNPYSPPQTAVADVPAPARPGNVTIAIWLVWAALILSPAVGIHQAVYTSSGIGVVAGLVTLALMYVIVVGLGIWIIGAAAKGARWARIVVSILALLQVASIVTAAVQGFSHYAAPVRYLEALLFSAALVLLFTPAANAWFRPRE